MPIVEEIPTFNSTGGNDASHMLHVDAHILSALSVFAKTGLILSVYLLILKIFKNESKYNEVFIF